MREPGRILLSSFLGLALLAPLLASGQDAAPSLGDMARKARQQKQTDDPQAQSSKPVRVITDEDVAPKESDPASTSKVGNQRSSSGVPASKDRKKLTAEQWKDLISAQKNLVRSMQTSIDRLSQSVYFHSETQVRWNERQRQKQQQIERMQTQLEDQKKVLGQMQEEARSQGYGNAVYDP